MATTHDLRYEHRDRRSWSWLIPLAIILLAAIALASYLSNDTTTSTTNLSELEGGVTTPTTGTLAE